MRTYVLSVLLAVGSFESEAQLIRFQQQGKVGYKSASGSIVVEPKYDAGSSMEEGLAVVLRGADRGYIDATGQEVIKCQFQDASAFVNGLSCVQKDGKWGFINKKGVWAIQPTYDNAFSFKRGLARVQIQGKWGMVNEQGEMQIPTLYARLYDISEGLIAASLDEQSFGYIDATGKTIIDFQYQLSQPFDETTHKAIVYLADGAFFINTQGKVIEKVPRPKDVQEWEQEEKYHKSH